MQFIVRLMQLRAMVIPGLSKFISLRSAVFYRPKPPTYPEFQSWQFTKTLLVFLYVKS